MLTGERTVSEQPNWLISVTVEGKEMIRYPWEVADTWVGLRLRVTLLSCFYDVFCIVIDNVLNVSGPV